MAAAVSVPPGRLEQEPFPPDVVQPEQRRRWELCAMTAWLVYGFDDESVLDRWDLHLLHHATRTYYESEFDTGSGVLSEENRLMLRARSAL